MESAHFSFDSLKLHAGEAFGSYRDLHSAGCDVETIGPAFRARFQGHALPQIAMLERHLNDVAHERTSERVHRDGFEHFTILANREGELAFRTPFGSGTVRPGEIVLFDTRHPQRIEARGAHILTFSIARELVEAARPLGHGLHGLVLSSGSAALLGDTMGSMVQHAGAIGAAQGERQVRIFRELLALALDAEPFAAQASNDALLRAQLVIEAGLALPDLTPELIAQQAGVSRSRLYELFKPQGGVARYLQQRRLLLFRRLLRHEDQAHRTIAEISHMAGLRDESHAIRAFRETFGLPPGQFRRRLMSAPGSPFADWVQALS